MKSIELIFKMGGFGHGRDQCAAALFAMCRHSAQRRAVRHDRTGCQPDAAVEHRGFPGYSHLPALSGLHRTDRFREQQRSGDRAGQDGQPESRSRRFPRSERQRAEVRPVVTLQPSATGGTSACRAVAEILDSFSAFSLVLAPGAPAAVSPGQSEFRLQGVAWGQALRLNVVASPPKFLRRTVELRGRAGQPGGSCAQGRESQRRTGRPSGRCGKQPGTGVRAARRVAPGDLDGARRGGIYVCDDSGSLRRV
jgi:hypothetical protein